MLIIRYHVFLLLIFIIFIVFIVAILILDYLSELELIESVKSTVKLLMIIIDHVFVDISLRGYAMVLTLDGGSRALLPADQLIKLLHLKGVSVPTNSTVELRSFLIEII